MCYAFCAVVIVGKVDCRLILTQIDQMVRNGNEIQTNQTRALCTCTDPVRNGKLRLGSRTPVTAGHYQVLPAAMQRPTRVRHPVTVWIIILLSAWIGLYIRVDTLSGSQIRRPLKRSAP